MRAVLAAVYRAHAELYPADAPSRPRDPRRTASRAINSALARWPDEWRGRGANLLHVDEDPFFDGELVKCWALSTNVAVARQLANFFNELRQQDVLPDVTRETVRGYLARAQTRVRAGTLRAATVSVMLRGLASAAQAVFPERDWRWLKSVERDMKRLVAGQISRNTARAHAAPELYLAGKALFEEGSRRFALASRRRERVKAFRIARTGLAVVLLIVTPVRIGSLTALRLGEHLDAGCVRFKLAAHETKEGKADERELPEPVRFLVHAYLKMRCSFAARSERSLFISERTGGAITGEALSRDVTSALTELLGTPVNPHAFRTSAATFIASEAPNEVDLATNVLNHASPDMTRRYRMRASQIVAGRALRDAYEEASKHLETR